MSDKKAEIEISASSAMLPAGLRRAAQLVADFAKGTKDAMAKLHLAPQENKKRDWAQHAIGQTVGNLATRGLDLLVDQGKAVFSFNDALVRFGISARMTPGQLDEIGKAARATSSAIGVDANEVLAAGRAYVDLAGAQSFSIQKMDLLARAAQASGSSTTDLAGMMYQLTRSMHVADNQMEDTMGGLINQAKDGAIEAKQMAAEFAGILPLFARFGVLGREGTVQAGALFQVMRDGANSASEAGTMMQRVYAGIQSYAPRFEKEGVQIYQKQRDRLGRKVLLPFSMIFKGIQNSQAMKDPALVKKMFGRTEGWRGMLLGDEAARMSDADQKAGRLLTRLEELENAGRVNGVIMHDMGTYADSSAGRMAIAFERMKNAVADAFTPERIEKFVAAIEGLVDKVGPLVEMVGKVGDVLGKIYGAGKSIRGALSHNVNNNEFSEALEEKSMDQLAVEARHKGLKLNQYLDRMSQNSLSYNDATKNIMEGMEGDKVTPEAIKRAVAQRYAGRDTPGGEGRFSAGSAFLENAQVGPAQVAEVFKQVLAERSDADIAAGRGRSAAAKQDMTDAFKQAISEALVPALNRSVRQVGDVPPVLQLDGNKLLQSSGNAADRRRK